jgi:hypothetical protein
VIAIFQYNIIDILTFHKVDKVDFCALVQVDFLLQDIYIYTPEDNGDFLICQNIQFNSSTNQLKHSSSTMVTCQYLWDIID